MEEGQPCYLVNNWPAESYRPGAFPLALAGSVASGVRLDRLDSFGVLWSFVRPDKAFRGSGGHQARILSASSLTEAHDEASATSPRSAPTHAPPVPATAALNSMASSASVFDAHLGSSMGVPAAILPPAGSAAGTFSPNFSGKPKSGAFIAPSVSGTAAPSAYFLRCLEPDSSAAALSGAQTPGTLGRIAYLTADMGLSPHPEDAVLVEVSPAAGEARAKGGGSGNISRNSSSSSSSSSSHSNLLLLRVRSGATAGGKPGSWLLAAHHASRNVRLCCEDEFAVGDGQSGKAGAKAEAGAGTVAVEWECILDRLIE